MAYPEVPIWLELLRLGRDFAVSGVGAALPHSELHKIERYCLFMGAPRNGHSLIGALLDAHPDMVIAHELGIPKYRLAHFSKRQIQLLLLSNSRRNARRGRRHIHYSHAVPGQWQGRYRSLRILGDKHGEGFLLSVRARPRLFEAVTRTLDPVRFIHVVRNPYDAIASVAGSTVRGQSVASAIAYFESLYETLAGISEKLRPGELHEIRFERFLEQPQAELEKACGFLGLEATRDYLENCASIVLREPEDHRGLVQWDSALRSRMDRLMGRHSFLAGYGFEQAALA